MISPAARRQEDASPIMSRLERLTPLLLAGIGYVPLLLTHRGMVGADTKQYLYLDPSRLLARAPSMWDPNVGMGTVTHQNIGYLVPMGPWYWVLHALYVPTWVAQRLWTGTLLFGAAMGVVFLLRTLGFEDRDRADPADHGPAVLVAALAYMLSPYVLEYVARISAILMPWAALPWMLALVIRGLRTRSWRHPALFALVVTLVGGVNATSLIYAGIAPVLWFPFAIWVTREVPWRPALATFIKTGLLTTLTALWWIAGLATQAGYGLDVLRYTETVPVVSQTGLPIEVLRGLGNWYFYGRDNVGPWVQPAAEYTQRLWLMAVSYAVPLTALVSAAVTRWRYRLYFMVLLAVGVAIAVGVHPYHQPSPLGSVFKAFATSSSAGLALRSVGRAAPLIALATAVLIGSAVDAFARRFAGTHAARGAALLVSALVIVNMAPLFTGQFLDDNLQRPDHIPAYWTAAARYLSGQGNATRVLELPGADFSHYRWGATLDPLTPGIMDRPFVGRELIPYGSAASADLIRALDERLQQGTFEPSSLAPMARLMNIGAVVLRSDLQYERFQTPRPQPTWALFNSAGTGLSSPVTFGPTVTGQPVIADLDETTLATPANAPNPPAVAVYPVPGAAPILHTARMSSPVIVAGNGDGLVDMAAAGLLDGHTGPVLYSAALAQDPTAMRNALDAGAALVVTDTNRKQGQRWGTIRDNFGYTETAAETPLVTDPTDARLPLFPGATTDSYTVTEERGVAVVRATAFGNPVSYAPGERPDLALDGDPTTAWKAGAFSDVGGDRLRIDLAAPVTTDHLNLVQPLVGARERYITKATITFDGKRPLPITLNPSSRTIGGQTVTFGRRTFRRVDITVDAMNIGRRADYRGGSPVGFAEVRIPGVNVTEFVRPPTDVLNAAGTQSLTHPLVFVLTRQRSNPLESFATDQEAALRRTFTLPTARSFGIDATARLTAADAADTAPPADSPAPAPSPLVDTAAVDGVIDADLGTAPGGILARSSERLPGDLHARASAAIDGDPGTAWTTAFGDQQGKWIELQSPRVVSFDHLDLSVVADGRHSVPTRLRVVAGSSSQVVNVPAVADGSMPNAVRTVRVPLQPVSGSTIRVTVLGVRAEKTINYLSQVPQTLPIGIAELGVPGLTQPLAQGPLPGTCRTDLLSVDGAPIGLRVVGTRAAALDRQALNVSLCGGPLKLGPGRHDLVAAPGKLTGFDLDRLVLSSAGGGGPASASTVLDQASGPVAPVAHVVHEGRTSATVTVNVTSGTQPFWLVLGQSHNAGWSAHSGGHSLGAPTLVDGFANGWLVHPGPTGGLMTIQLDWTPQHRVRLALLASALAVLACVVLVIVGGTRTGPWRRWVDPADRLTTLPSLPALALPWRWAGGPVTGLSARALALAGGFVAAFVIAPAAGLVVWVALTLSLSGARRRWALTVVGVGLMAAASLYVLQLQLRYRFPTKIEWPEHFDKVALLPWIAVGLLVADAVVDHLRSRRRGSAPT